MIGDSNGFETYLAGRNVDIAAHKVHEGGTLKEELSHPGIVVVGRGHETVGALLRFLRVDGMWNEPAVRLAKEAGSRSGFLSVVEPLPVGVLRADENCAG